MNTCPKQYLSFLEVMAQHNEFSLSGECNIVTTNLLVRIVQIICILKYVVLSQFNYNAFAYIIHLILIVRLISHDIHVYNVL